MSYGNMYNPPNPYLGPIPGGISPGKMIRINGTVPPTADRFAVNLQCGPNVNPRDDLALHVNFRFPEGCVVRNHLQGMGWGAEETSGGLPLSPGQPFQILLLAEHTGFKIALNGGHFCEFLHRIPYQRISYLTIDGDVSLSLISFDGGDAGYQQAPPSYTAATSPPMGFAGAGAPQGYPLAMPSMGLPAMGMQGAPPPAYGQPQQFPPNPSYPQNAALSYGGVPPMGYPQQSQGFGSNNYGGGGMPNMMGQQRPKESSAGMTALKYGMGGVGLAGVGLGAYALGGGFSGHSDDENDPPEAPEPAADDDDWLG